MRRFTSINVGLVGVLSCLVLVLALFFATGVASARGTQAAHSQTSLTSLSTLTVDQCPTIYVQPGHYYGGRYYASGGNVTVCGQNDYYNGYYGSYSGCRKVFVQSGSYAGISFISGSGYITLCGSSSTCSKVYVPHGYYNGIYFSYSDYIAVCS